MENLFIEFLPPWIETNLQPAFYDAESGSVLQLTALIYGKVNELTGVVNKYTEDFTTLYNYVHDYFDNLDVQSEVNKKIDEMVEDGTLQEIIDDYLNSIAVFGFTTVADMVSSTNLSEGSYAKTTGYYNANDLGGNTYKIKTSTTSLFAIELDNGLFAEPVMQESMNILQFGIRGSDTTSTTKMQSVIDSCDTLNFNKETYTINGYISLHTKSHINLNGATLNFTTRYGFKNLKETDTFTGYNGNSDITIENGTINGGAIVIGHGKNITVKNIDFVDCLNDHWFEIGGSKNVIVENCQFGGRPDASGGGITSTSFSIINIDPILATPFPHYTAGSTSYDGTLCSDIYIKNNVMNPLAHIDDSITTVRGIDIHYEATEISNHNNVCILNNIIYGKSTYINVIYHVDNLEFANNKIVPATANATIALGYTTYAHIHDNVYCKPVDDSSATSPIVLRENRDNTNISYYSNSFEQKIGGSSFSKEITFQNNSAYSFSRLSPVVVWSGTNTPNTGYTFPVDYTKFNSMMIGVGTGGNLKTVQYHAYITRFFQSGDVLIAPTVDGRIKMGLKADNTYDYDNNSTTDTGNNLNLRYILVGVE